MTLVRLDGNTWTEHTASAGDNASAGGGIKTLSGELTTLQLYTLGAGSFDAGSANVICL